MRKAQLIASMVFALLALMCLAGCTSPVDDSPAASEGDGGYVSNPIESNKQTKEILPLEMLDSGYTITSNEFGYFGFIVKNPNKTLGINSAAVKVTVKDESGGIISTQDCYLSYIAPETVRAYGGMMDTKNEKVGSVVFEPSTIKEYDAINPESAEALYQVVLTVSGIKEISTEYSTSFTGEIQNTGKVDVSAAEVIVILRNAAGDITGAQNGYASDIPAGGSSAFEITLFDDIEYSKFEIFAYPSY